MSVPKDSVPSLSDCQCQICLDILIEPVTLPCNHTLCKSCFQLTIEKTSICCPFCRRRISSWARYHAGRNSLVNVELWELIQKHYPTKCRLRILGEEYEDTLDESQPAHLGVSEPGELQRDREEEKYETGAECQVPTEAQSKASKEHSVKLSAEEEQRQAGKHQCELKKRLKIQALGRKLSVNVKDVCGRDSVPLPSQSTKPEPMATESPRKNKAKKRNISKIHTCLSSTSQFGSTSQAVSVQKVRRKSKVKKTAQTNKNAPLWQGTDTKEDKPILPAPVTPEIPEQAATSSTDPSMLSYHPHNTESGFEGRMKTRSQNPDRDQLQAKVPSFREQVASVSDLSQTTGNNTVETEKTEPARTARKAVAKRKNQESSFRDVNDPCFSSKRRELSPSSSSDTEGAENHLINKLSNLQNLLTKSHQQERDWLFALKLQEEEDRKGMKPNRQKGSSDEYQLRTASALADVQGKSPKAGTSKAEVLESQKGSTDDN
ncbi:E3 ubiquitin-protein ligase RNF168-like [Ochotona princeps]|uniref:E3 ubiquitin-protein ligase RNF168-like n=1 Tax=Ochotona princeps TaxID=9978 RepID=UPI0027150475|nr:E3 ubiquitin-protein ligase RNF168-like [Ochotona princeps]